MCCDDCMTAANQIETIKEELKHIQCSEEFVIWLAELLEIEIKNV